MPPRLLLLVRLGLLFNALMATKTDRARVAAAAAAAAPDRIEVIQKIAHTHSLSLTHIQKKKDKKNPEIAGWKTSGGGGGVW